MKIKLAAVAKDEGAYLPQWIYHHLYFGFDMIEVWINGCCDNSISILDAMVCAEESRLEFVNATPILNECLVSGKNFQKHAYQLIFDKTRQLGGYTHLIFLDLDEYWVPTDFKTPVHNAIGGYDEADAISYQWYLDGPCDERKPFEPLFGAHNRVLSSQLVKTLIKITDRVHEIHVHNHGIRDGHYLLSDGTQFYPADLVNDEYYVNHRNEMCDYFIHHHLYRSQVEYLSLLYRGNPDKVGLFKDNRLGYISRNFSYEPYISWFISQQELDSYNNYIRQQINAHVPPLQQYAARASVYQRAKKVLDLIRNDASLLELHDFVLRGVRFNDLSPVPFPGQEGAIKYCIDQINVDKQADTLTLIGWAFDEYRSSLPRINLTSCVGFYLELVEERIQRDDVAAAYLIAPIDAGFQITVNQASLVLCGFQMNDKWLSVTISSGETLLSMLKDGFPLEDAIYKALAYAYC